MTRPASLRRSFARGLSLGLLLGLVAPPGKARGQVVELRVRDDSTRGPVVGAIARLVGPDGVAAQGLTNMGGRVALRAPRPGRWRIQVDRIGFRSFVTEELTVAVGDTVRQSLSLPFDQVFLEAIEVRTDVRCDDQRRGGTRAAALWEEIQKALTANLITQASEATTLRVTLYERTVDLRGTVQEEREIGSRVSAGAPFVSVDPLEMAERGFVTMDGDSLSYYAPDAELILSDEFVGSHCFRAVPDSAGMAGLVFEPIPDRKQPDVRGTLWVDQASRELRFIEYRYTGLTGVAEKSGAGGEVRFRRLPEGTWIVDHWLIRMPVAVWVGARREAVLRAYRERGGRAMEVSAMSTRLRVTGVVRGVVWDSLAGGPLAGAWARVLNDSVLTDTEGHFQLETEAGSRRVIALRHPRLGLIPDGTTQVITVGAGDTAGVAASVPAIGRFRAALCGAGAGAGILGLAWDETGPAAGLTVRLSWSRPAAGGRGAVAESRETESGGRGLYRFCSLPAGPRITVQLLSGGRVVAETGVVLAPGETVWLELRPRLELSRPLSRRASGGSRLAAADTAPKVPAITSPRAEAAARPGPPPSALSP